MYLHVFVINEKILVNTFLRNYEIQKLGINMDSGWIYRAYRNRDQGAYIILGVMFLSRFSHLCIYIYLSLIKIFMTLFLGTMKARKLKHGINMDNRLMYRAYRKRGQGPIAFGVISLDSIFFQLIMQFAYYILYLWTYFKETSIITALQVKEGVVAQKRGQQP